jgi:hypothetical protein
MPAVRAPSWFPRIDPEIERNPQATRVSKEGERSESRKRREEKQLKVFRNVTNDKERHDHHGHGCAVVNVYRANEVSRFRVEIQPAARALTIHLDPANPGLE